jgi:hypothetical protein
MVHQMWWGKVLWSIAIIGSLLVLSIAAHRYLQSRIYHPVVLLDLPEGLSLTTVLQATTDEQGCRKVSERYLAPYKQQCSGCRIISTTCARVLDGLPLALENGSPIPHPVILARGSRVAISGSQDKAQMMCEAAAEHARLNGLSSTVCVKPNKPFANPGT